MSADAEPWIGLATALGAGLLVGVERERRKGTGQTRAFAGVRTFAIASLAGALSMLSGLEVVAAVTLSAVAALAIASYWRDRSDDPGTTTEVALIATVLIGMIAMSEPVIAAGAAIALVALLFTRTSVQKFAVNVLSEREFADAIVLLSLALILLPLLPDRDLSATIAVNPHRVLRLVVIMSAIQAFGYVMLRMFGHRLGVPLAGLVSGFVSSTATHSAMSARARANPKSTSAYTSGAVLSNVATAIQGVLIVLATSPSRLPSLAPYLLTMGVTAAICGAIAFRRITDDAGSEPDRRAFSLWHALTFAVLLTSAAGASAWIAREWGDVAAWAAIMVAAMVDLHVAIAALASQSTSSNESLVVPLLICLSINASMKAIVSFASAGASRYSFEVVACLAAIVVTPWAVFGLKFA